MLAHSSGRSIKARPADTKPSDTNASLTEPQQAEKAGRLGEALALYQQASRHANSLHSRVAAAFAAERIAQQAEKELTEALAMANRLIVAKSRAAGPYKVVAKQLDEIAQTYAGSFFADRADAQKKALLNAKADQLESRAKAAKTVKDYKKAIQLYQLYLSYFPEADRYAEVKAHLKALKANRVEK